MTPSQQWGISDLFKPASERSDYIIRKGCRCQLFVTEAAFKYSMQTVRFSARFEFLDEIREFVGDIAYAGGFTDREIYNIQLATDEAASNIIEHAYEGVSGGVLEISCGIKGSTITIILVDHGESFDPSEVPVPDLKADLSERKIGGLGIFLMRKLMDEVHYKAEPGKNRNTLTMIKRRR